MGEITAMGSAKHVMHELNRSGDTKVMWNPRDADEVENARKTFIRLLGKGFKAFRVSATGGQEGRAITEFDPNAEKIIFIPQLAGG